MNNILSIRKRLGLQQADFGEAIGVSQSNVSHYETGKNDPSIDVGLRVVAVAKEQGVAISLDDIYTNDASA